MTKTLFVLKYREDPYASDSTYSTWGDAKGRLLSSGLFNSARFVVEMLQRRGKYAKLVHVLDNNYIHREIVSYGQEAGGPVTHCVIEAFWVVPSKFDELKKACPGVTFVIRNHSETPFLAQEGIAFNWTLQYAERDNVLISCNSERMLEETRFLIARKFPYWSRREVEAKTPFLPNYYPVDDKVCKRPDQYKEHIDIACFGAIRPLKNHVMQAIAAIKFAHGIGKKLRFHINASRIEMNGLPIVHNLRGIFAHYPEYELVEHQWMPHSEFQEIIAEMDILMQVSFTETFNIVAADAVAQGVPIVTSPEVRWASGFFYADPTDVDDIARSLNRAWLVHTNFWTFNPSLGGLKKYNKQSEKAWLAFLT